MSSVCDSMTKPSIPGPSKELFEDVKNASDKLGTQIPSDYQVS